MDAELNAFVDTKKGHLRECHEIEKELRVFSPYDIVEEASYHWLICIVNWKTNKL